MKKITIRVVETMTGKTFFGSNTMEWVANNLAQRMAAVTGGATVNAPSLGVWIDGDGKPVTEQGQDVWTLVSDDAHIDELRQMAVELKLLGKQDCVLFMVEETKAEFV